jgi:hypothetical protein
VILLPVPPPYDSPRERSVATLRARGRLQTARPQGGPVSGGWELAAACLNGGSTGTFRTRLTDVHNPTLRLNAPNRYGFMSDHVPCHSISSNLDV